MPDWLQTLLSDYGYWIVFTVIFFNNIGLPVPGDTFLLGAGFLTAEDMFHLPVTIAVAATACFLGGDIGYWVGWRFGRKVLARIGFLRMTPEKIDQVELFLKRRGAKAVFFARFVALVHPVTGLLAGVGGVGWGPFLAYNFLGSMAYAVTYALLGYFFGESWELLRHWLGRTAVYSLALLVTIIFLTLILRRPVAMLLERFSKKRWLKRF